MRSVILLFTIVIALSCKTRQKEETGSSAICIQSFAQTFPMPNGNRCLESIDLSDSRTIVIPLSGQPVWVTGMAQGNRQLWAVALQDGTINLIQTKKEIPLLCTTHDALYAVSYKNNKLKCIWNSPLQGISVTNIARAGHAAIALGTDKNVLKIWFAKETHY